MRKKIIAIGASIALGLAATAILGASTSFARPLACADGGACRVGDTGPGGGIVFYLSATGFNCGSNGLGSCHYLEVAPNGWRVPPDPQISWATNGDSNNQSLEVTGAGGTAIGSGFPNSIDIVNQSGNVAASSAAVAAREYDGGSKSDWYLPAKDELNELCKYVKGQRTGDPAKSCGSSRKVKSGFVDGLYWSSSEYNDITAWSQAFVDGLQFMDGKSSLRLYVRPVRAF